MTSEPIFFLTELGYETLLSKPLSKHQYFRYVMGEEFISGGMR